MGEFKVVSLARLSAGRSGIGGAGAVALEAGYREIPTSQSLCVKGKASKFIRTRLAIN
jgi:hypothetical protein